ncbi:SDR family NAD(P)-dependent oxidoreductase [Desertihabitans aurantiacus]|uniref:SDR family NAD(P)-dependent oxidoreductase n=1 Tax=Desertihabitans aurantiacus TaxID=2282477 RepID=UPI000DF75D13|nr:SDR family NAD(P)-dependent oxidoreductase [Desertihabitans aurantiacus]
MAGRPLAVVTGASSGIGAASARALAAAGFDLVVGARRVERMQPLAEELGADVRPLDVTDAGSVRDFCAGIERCEVLVNNAGGAIGTEPVAEADPEDWRTMYETNVLGTLHVTQALLPALVASGDGRVITIGSVAGREPYPGGAGYNAAKHAVSAFSRVLRMELLGQPVRVSQIDPGMVETEFSVTRFRGDADAAAKVYEGMTPLSADDVADAVVWVATRPKHVNIDQILMLATDQSSARVVHRR